MQINIIDIFVIAVVAIGALRGLLRGLSRELADLIRVAGAFLAAYLLYQPLTEFLVEKSRLSDFACGVLSFIIVLVAAFILLSMLHVFLSKFMQFAFKGLIERLGGLLSGTVKGAIFAAIVIMLFAFWPHPSVQSAVREDSVCGRWLTEKTPGIYLRITERYPSLREFEHSLSNSVPDIVKPDHEEEAESESNVE